MPNIKTYEAPNLGLQPTEVGIDATVQAGRGIGRFYNQAGAGVTEVGDQLARGIGTGIKDIGEAAVQYADYRDRSNTSAVATAGLAGLEQKWQQTLKGVPDPNNPGAFLVPPADPNDPTVKERFQNEQVEPFLDNLRQIPLGENGQRYAEGKAEEIRQHISTKLTADMSTQAGNAVVLNRISTINNLGALVTTDPSFSTVDFALKQSRDDMASHTASPTLTADQVGKLQIHQAEDEKKIVEAAAVSALSKSSNPAATADEFLRRYSNLFAPGDSKILTANALQQVRARNYDFELARRRAKEEAQDVSNDATNQYIIDVRSRDPRLKDDPLGQKILNDPNLLRADKNNLLNYVDRQLKPETDARTSRQTFVDLLRQMRGPDADLDSVMQKAWDARLTDPEKPGSLTEGDFDQFRKEIVARKTPEGAAIDNDRSEFFKRFQRTIDGGMSQIGGQPSALGQQKMYEAEMDARRQEQLLRKKGDDPQSMYDPSSPNYFGKQLAKYHVTMDAADKYSTGIEKGGDLNLTGPGKTITGIQVDNEVPVPKNTSPADVLKTYKPGTIVVLPDGRKYRVPNAPQVPTSQ